MLTREELAIKLGVSPRTIDNWRKDGMPTIKKGNYVRFELDKVLSWLRNDK